MNQILMLSRDQILKQNISKTLTEAGFQITIVSGLLEGLGKLDDQGFGLVIIDEELSDADIYRACRRIRDSFEIPTILLGSKAVAEIWDKVEDLGFDFYVKKPVNPAELVARIKFAIKRTVRKEVSTAIPISRPDAEVFQPEHDEQIAVAPVMPEVNERNEIRQNFFGLLGSIIAVAAGLFLVFLSLTPTLWTRLDWDIYSFTLGVAVAALGFCFLTMCFRVRRGR